MSYRATAFALGMVLATCVPASADSVVTLCQSDRQAGGGTNLATAVSSGGLVVFNCGGTANVRVSTSLTFSRNVVIDGGNTVTLVGDAELPMFVASADVSIELKNLKFRDTKSGIVRGGPKGSPPVTITGSTFTNCAPVVGLSVGVIVIRDSVFTNCTGHVITGSERLTVERSRFEGTRTDGTPGVAIFAVGNELRIVDSIFTGNQGGAVLIGVGSAGDDNHKVEIVRSAFDNNGREDPAGLTNGVGAVSLLCSDKARSCTIKASNSKFSRNKAENGAAMVVSGAAEVSLRGSRFEGNVAKKEGGAVHYTQRSEKAARSPRLEMLHTVFTDNSAEIGGAVRVSDARIAARAVAFSKNRAANLGGAIAAQTGPVQIDRGVFLDNSADSHGAVSLFRNRQATISNTIIARNTSRNGGGVFTAAAARFINSTIVDNVGIGIQRPFQGVGAGVGGSIRFRNTIISNNSAGNCTVFASWQSVRFIDDGTNLQFPDTSCGESIPVANPHLDKLYLPVFGSPPWSRGHNPTCLESPVSARDVYNKVRPIAIACSIGAAEGDLEKEVADRTVGGANWPDGLNNGDGSKQKPKTGPAGPSSPQPSDPSKCCCFFACRR